MLSKTFPIVFALFTALSLGVSPLIAQEKRPERKNVQLKGSIEDMARGIAKIIDGDQAEWLVKSDGKTKFTFSATAEPEWLRRGMWVRVTTKFNSQGVPQETVKNVVVFAPVKGEKLGIYSEDKVTITNPFTKSLADVPEGERLKAYTIAGRVKGFKGNELTIAAGRLTVTVPLDERSVIRVEVADPTLIRKGDEVTIRGWQVPNAENAVVATTIAVTAKEPLASQTKKSGKDSKGRDAKKKDTKKDAANDK
jgi:hypothetical protein